MPKAIPILLMTLGLLGATPEVAMAAEPSPDHDKTEIVVSSGHSPRSTALMMGMAPTDINGCDWVSVTMTRDTVYTLVARLDWCHNGVNVVGYGTWSPTAHGIYYFDGWTNPPNDYYDQPSHYTIHTVGQARFCAFWCAVAFYPGVNIWGNADGTWDVSYP